MPVEQGGVGPGKEGSSGQNFVQRNRQRILVDASVVFIAQDQLGCHIQWSADNAAGLCLGGLALGRCFPRIGGNLGDSKIAEIDVLVHIKHDVFRLDVAVNEMLLVHEIECFAEVRKPLEYIGWVDRLHLPVRRLPPAALALPPPRN